MIFEKRETVKGPSNEEFVYSGGKINVILGELDAWVEDVFVIICLLLSSTTKEVSTSLKDRQSCPGAHP